MEVWNGGSLQPLHLSLTRPSPPLGEGGWEEGGGEVEMEPRSFLLAVELGGEVMDRGEEGLPPPLEWVEEGGGREGKAPRKEEKEEKREGDGEV